MRLYTLVMTDYVRKQRFIELTLPYLRYYLKNIYNISIISRRIKLLAISCLRHFLMTLLAGLPYAFGGLHTISAI